MSKKSILFFCSFFLIFSQNSNSPHVPKYDITHYTGHMVLQSVPSDSIFFIYMKYHWCHASVQLLQILKGHDDHVITCLEFCGQKIVSGSDDNTLKVWSVITGKVRQNYFFPSRSKLCCNWMKYSIQSTCIRYIQYYSNNAINKTYCMSFCCFFF